jgi:hypothetical protein
LIASGKCQNLLQVVSVINVFAHSKTS